MKFQKLKKDKLKKTKRMSNKTEIKSVLLSLSNNLMVKDVEKTISYYNNIGFKTVYKSTEDGVIYWAFVKKNEVELFFQSNTSLTDEFPELKNQEKGGALTLWFRVENIDQWYQEIKNKTEIIKPFGITSYNGAKEFVVKDINGFILHFSDFDLNKALNNLQLEL